MGEDLVLWLASSLVELGIAFLAVKYLYNHIIVLRSITLILSVVTIGFAAVMVYVHGLVWLPAMLLVVYRVVNLLRIFYRRHHQERLRRLVVPAHIWIIGLQLFLLFIGLVLFRYELWQSAVISIAILQLTVALFLLRTTMQTWHHTKVPPELSRYIKDSELPAVSILIPARNETETLERCLTSLIESDYPKLEIIALDDCSANKKTHDIIKKYAQAGVRFVAGDSVDEINWLAKNHAYRQLANEATGSILVFCGADVVVERHTLRKMVETLISEKKEMISVLPQRSIHDKRRLSLVQPMRYYWELCFPRRLFKRPPVLSTFWMVYKDSLDTWGGFESVSQSITPEAHMAKQAVISDTYLFIQSTPGVPVYSTKSAEAQFDTMIRVRYPQLHRRIEMVVLASMFQTFFLIAPFLFLPFSYLLPGGLAFALMWGMTIIIITAMYMLVAVKTRLNNSLIALLTTPIAFTLDLVLIHISMIRYEFGTVLWKNRNICYPIMRFDNRDALTNRNVK